MSSNEELMAAVVLLDKSDSSRLSYQEIRATYGSCHGFMETHGLRPWYAEDCAEAIHVSRVCKQLRESQTGSSEQTSCNYNDPIDNRIMEEDTEECTADTFDSSLHRLSFDEYGVEEDFSHLEEEEAEKFTLEVMYDSSQNDDIRDSEGESQKFNLEAMYDSFQSDDCGTVDSFELVYRNATDDDDGK